MNTDQNPLRNLPKIVRFQIMSSLAMMWSIVFCAWMGLMHYAGTSIAVHAVLVTGIIFTADIFRRANNGQPLDHRRMYRDPTDNGVLYDDIWGG